MIDDAPPIGDLDVVPGRVPPPHTQAPDWVALSGVSPEAHSLHVKLAMHMNRDRGDSVVWPGTDSLAALMGASRGDKVTRWLHELVAIGAIEIRREGLHRRNIYIVNTIPPEGYEKPVTLKQWYAENRDRLTAAKADAKAKRDARRKNAKQQVTPVTPETGEQPVTPETGEPVTPKPGAPVTPFSGREQEEEEQDEVEQDPNLPSVGSRSTSEDHDRRRRTTLVQPRLDGTEPDPPNCPDLRETAFGIARGWIEYRNGQGVPIVLRGKTNPLHAIRNLLEPALQAGYTENEIKNALARCRNGIPSVSQLDGMLAELRRNPSSHRPPAARSGGSGGVMAGAGLHVEGKTREEREARNPFNPDGSIRRAS